jgi:hypothetical protein
VHAARSCNVAQTGICNRQSVRPPATTVKDFVPDLGLKFRAVGLGILSPSRSARMFFDDTRFPPDTDRTADVEVLASTSDREHVVIFSINSAY